ncbi:porin [Duganella sp. FT109W]|uniref:Porin n=1 Tax=Duganella margarita TaxID=2692170 RepID=A0ABW9WPN5_9BURK|nr:porin [Duganella margarita]MYN43201.1 porin [Duganella margarita]
MKFPGIPAALALLLSGAASAQSSVQVYGVLDMWAGRSETSAGGPASSVVNSGGLQTSYWGFGGAEDLGTGLKAIFAVEGYLLLDTGTGGRTPTDALFARNAYIGLQGAAGELKIGRVLNPLFVATAQSNPFGGSIRLAPLLAQVWSIPMGRTVYGDTSWDNAVAYTTPVAGGFKLASIIGLGETRSGTRTNNLGATATFERGPWMATLTAQRVRVGPGLATVGESEQRTYFAGGSYNAGAAKLFASWNAAVNQVEPGRGRTAQAGVAVPAGPGSILLSWAQTRNSGAPVADTRRDTGALGYQYFLSKRTELYAVFQNDKLSSASLGKTYALGMRLKF